MKYELYNMRMQEGAELNEHVNAFNRVVLDLEPIVAKVEDKDRAFLMLTSVPKSYRA
jgi:hypothetical protein